MCALYFHDGDKTIGYNTVTNAFFVVAEGNQARYQGGPRAPTTAYSGLLKDLTSCAWLGPAGQRSSLHWQASSVHLRLYDYAAGAAKSEDSFPMATMHTALHTKVNTNGIDFTNIKLKGDHWHHQCYQDYDIVGRLGQR